MAVVSHVPSRALYRAGCRCVGCRVANAMYQRAHRAGQTRRVSAAAAVAHLRRVPGSLMAKARAARVSDRHLRAVVAGAVPTITTAVATRILALPMRRQHGLVKSFRTKSLVRAIVAEGWTRQAIADELGVPLSAILCRRPTMRAATADKIERLYQRLMDDEDTGAAQQPSRRRA